MSKVFTSADQLIGKTPILELTHIEKELNLKAKIFAKLEFLNPAGSIKDRVALSMILDAEMEGKINKDTVLIEPTSGNTGIGIASVGTAKGYKVIIVMPSTMSVERRQMIGAYGAKVVLSDGEKGMSGAIELANEIARKENGVVMGQFNNPSNVKAHYFTTGPEIFDDMDGKIDYLVAGVGTGGTITGTGKFLKEKLKGLKVVAVEPQASPLLSKGVSGAHGIQGIGANFIPEILDTDIYDEVVAVSDEDAFSFGRLIGKKEGVLVGISSGAALFSAVLLAKKQENANKNIVVIFPDSGDRYLSTPMFNE